MDGKVETVKLAVSGVIATLITAFGADHKYVTVLVTLMVADTTLGWIKGFKLKKFKSERAKWGFTGKIVELGLVYLLGRLDWAFGTAGLLANIGVLYYGIVELASIVENINDGGLATLPVGMVELLRKLKYSAGKTLVDRLKKVVASAVGIDPDVVKNEEKGEKNDEHNETNIPE